MHIVAAGRSGAGISAALRARELDLGTDFTVAAVGVYPNFSVCGIPYYISGEVKLLVTGSDGTEDVIAYDQLITGTGAVPVRPPVTSLDETETEGRPDA